MIGESRIRFEVVGRTHDDMLSNAAAIVAAYLDCPTDTARRLAEVADWRIRRIEHPITGDAIPDLWEATVEVVMT